MHKLVYLGDQHPGYASDGQGRQWSLHAKPELPLGYARISFIDDAERDNIVPEADAEPRIITPAEVQQLRNWLDAHTPYSNNQEQIHAVDNQGKYLGLVPPSPNVQRVDNGPPDARSGWVSQNGEWHYERSLAEAKATATSEIDRVADAAYKKVVETEQKAAEYKAAYDEALAWLANTSGTVPPRINALAALYSVPAPMAANVVKAKYEQGQAALTQMGTARLVGKASIAQATTVASVDAALAATVSALHSVSFSI